MNQCQLREDGCDCFAQGLKYNSTLKDLNLSENNFGDYGVKYLSE